jgi:toxin ParE1/3/4
MSKLIISPEADQDLLEIWLYIAEDSPDDADRFLDRLEENAQKLAEFTEIGRDRPELAPNLKSFSVDRYILYYRPDVDGIELVRILHAARDINQIF